MLKKILKLETPYVDMQTLKSFLQGYQNPKDYIWRLVKKGELIRLKNGFFLIKDQIEEQPIPFEQIANLLYGPSYVSLEYALSFYGMIPEAVYAYTSITLGKTKHYPTPIGTFSYYHLREEAYDVGVTHKENSLGGFTIASAEKALADHVFQLCKGLNAEDLMIDLTESRRIELSVLRNLDKILMQQIANCYRSEIVTVLAKIIMDL